MLQSAGKKKRVVKFAAEDQIIPSTSSSQTAAPPPSPSAALPAPHPAPAPHNSYENETIANNLTHKFFSPKLGAPGSIRFRSREDRTRTAREAGINTTGGTVSNPDFADTLRRVSVVVQQHIIRGERVKRKYHHKMTAEREAASNGSYNSRRSNNPPSSPEMTVSFSSEGHVDLTGDRRKRTPSVQLSLGGGASGSSSGETKTALEPRISLAAQLPVSERLAASSSFREDLFVKPTWKYTFIRPPPSAGLFLTNYRMEKIKKKYTTPEVKEIHAFINNLFIKGQVRVEGK